MSRQFRTPGGRGNTDSKNAPAANANNGQPTIELENQFLLRLPPEPAEALREAIRSGASNLKDRLFIQMEPDKASTNQHLRRGGVRFDGWAMSSKLVDLPTIMETHKTIDRKTIYKTADVCQLLICKEGEQSDEDEDEAQKQPKKDPNKVDKKFLYPHGICAPLKNCRKRRFRKTLKKKYGIDEPEIEKEVKRLFRVDNEAVDVKWELLTEEELNAGKDASKAGGATGDTTSQAGGPDDTSISAAGVAEHDLFGALTDSEDENGANESGGPLNKSNVEMYSEGDSTMYGDLDNKPPVAAAAAAATATPASSSSSQPLVTQFSKDMFPSGQDQKGGEDAVAVKMAKVNAEISQLRKKKQEMESNIASCPNQALLHRLKDNLKAVESELKQRELEADAFSMFS